MHRDWFIEGANVFVEIFSDRIEVSSPGGLPKGMLLKDLGHKSVRRNALIADLLHRIAFIEKAGTGILRMRDSARAEGYPEPAFIETGFFSVMFRPISNAAGHDEVHDTLESTVQELRKHPTSIPQVGTKLAPSWHQVEILRKCNKDSTLVDIMAITGRSDRTKFRHQVLNPLIEAGLIEMTIPDKPRSSKQQYRTTAAGRHVLENADKEPPP
ncbi:MAG: ATP-dependent helicase RecG [Thermodesulfobacteriota bacterium]|nr:ATP-dependent helicase RecG [Thermodesulfobacteriota bacterium]